MAAVAYWLPRQWNDNVEVVLLNGAMNIRPSPTRTNNVAELFAQARNGRATMLPVPAIVGLADTRQVLERDPVIAGTLQLGMQAPAICFGLGGVTSDFVLVQSGCITEVDIASLRAKGAVGDIVGRFIDAESTYRRSGAGRPHHWAGACRRATSCSRSASPSAGTSTPSSWPACAPATRTCW